ncbi:MAG: hypothetical protein K8T90_13980 [Planctomycetes bacterium]|nr:hypothetical protein [Planctomycetota bacterium]
MARDRMCVTMLADLTELRESVFAVRLLREEILATPLRPDAAARLRRVIVARNGDRLPAGTVAAALSAARATGGGVAGVHVDGAWLRTLAEACGGGAVRSGPGVPFHGRAAPPASRVPDLLAEMIETLNSPVAFETWPAPVRAFAAHFLVRLVQPFDAPPAALGFAVEVAVLAADGFSADRVLLPEPSAGEEVAASRPDPDEFVRARLDRLVERLAETQDLLRTEAARAVLASWADDRRAQGTAHRLNERQRRLVRWFAEQPAGDGDVAPRSLAFRDYVRLHSGRRAPSLRSLQRDWKGLRERGLLAERGGNLVLDPEALSRGPEISSG